MWDLLPRVNIKLTITSCYIKYILKIKNMNFALNKYLTDFIDNQVGIDYFQSRDEVIRASLRLLERETQQTNLRKFVYIGIEQADKGEFVNYPLSAAIADIENNNLT